MVFAALAAFVGFCADDDSAVANRKWVREYVAGMAVQAKPKLNPGESFTATSSVAGTNGMEMTTTVRVPTNEAIFVAWTTETRVPAYSYYARIPGQNLFACATNSFMPTISYTVTNWTERATNDLGVVMVCEHSATRWYAKDATGAKWCTAYLGGNTILCNSKDTTKYIVIQKSTVSDKAAKILRGSYELDFVKYSAPPFSFLSLFVSPAYADDLPGVEVDRGSGTLGYHEAVEIGALTISNKLGTETYYLLEDGHDHQYNPYGGIDHADLAADEAYYRSDAARLDPRNWGFVFDDKDRLLVAFQHEDGTWDQAYITRQQLMESDAWQRAVNVDLPKPNQKTEPTLSDPSEHECKVYDANGKHIGCVCDFPYCQYCPSCEGKTYTITREWRNPATGAVIYTEDASKVTLHFAGARHNIKQVAYGALEGGGMGYAEAAEGCTVCWDRDNAREGTHFCGNADKDNPNGAALSSHAVNDPNVTGREECGCMCRKYHDGSSAVPTDMHVHPSSGDEGHGAHSGQDSYCWCYCKRQHDGTFYADGEDSDTCPGHCAICGAYKTINGEEIDGTFANPLPYQVTDDGGLPSLDEHTPSESRCGCKCGAISPDNDDTYPLMKEEESYHFIEDGGCTCSCIREMHKVVNDTGHCSKVCTLCGKVNEKDADGCVVAVAATWSDHTPDGNECGCECYNSRDGFNDSERGYCGFKGNETTNVKAAPEWHVQRDAEHCCCKCGAWTDHRDNRGKHAEWFVEGEYCLAVCSGINASGQKCGKVINANRPAKWSEHDPSPDGCGCACGDFAGNETGMKDADEYHHRDGSTCHCVCQGNWSHHEEWMTAKGSLPDGLCENVCTCGRYRDGTREATMDDHTGKDDACGCKCGEMNDNVLALKFHNGYGTPLSCHCACGKVHRWFDGSTAQCMVCSVCKMTEDDQEPTDEKLHKLNPSLDCTCWCGYFGPGNHTAKTEALHEFSDDEDSHGIKKCTCKCEKFHVFRDGGAYLDNQELVCPDVCAYCKDRLLDGSRAEEKDHTPKSVSAARCGCRCGKLDHSSKEDKFHIRKPGTCRCFGAYGTGGEHHFRDPKAGCTKICSYRIDGKEHLAAAHDHDTSGIEPATKSAHTTYTGNGCRCACGDITGAQADCPDKFHKRNPSSCYCFCAKKKPEGDVRGDSCYCKCGEKHLGGVQRSDGKCPEVCHGICGQATNSAYKERHDPNQHGCGCDCGAFGGSSYSSTTFHQGHGSPSCMCTCGKYHCHSESRDDCTLICRICGDTKEYVAFSNPRRLATQNEHTPKEDGCGCACGKNHLPHNMPLDRCKCFCGQVKIDHDWNAGETTGSYDYPCPTCGNSVTVYTVTFTCNRCGEEKTAEGERGHVPGCGRTPSEPGDQEEGASCVCGCKDCPCGACKSKAGKCETCGKSCDSGSTSEGGGSGGIGGGQTGGGGNLGDI